MIMDTSPVAPATEFSPSKHETSAINGCRSEADVGERRESRDNEIPERGICPCTPCTKEVGAIEAQASSAESVAPADAGAPTGRGVVLSNTPPLSSRGTGSEDWFEVAAYVDWNPDEWPKVHDRLEEYKALASNDDVPEEFQWSVNGHQVNVDRMGARLGKGRKGPYFAYKMEYAGIDILIADRMRAHETIPNVILLITGTACLTNSSHGCLALGREFITRLGGMIMKDKLSRVDVALDMPGVDMGEFEAAFNEDRYICRSKSIGYHKSTGVTLCFGESPLLLRIYDKLAESGIQSNALKRTYLIFYRWGGEVPKCASRVEFEIRREALKSVGIDTVSDYFEKRSDLVCYLTHHWFRMTIHTVKRENKNQSRAKVSPLWQEVQSALAAWAGTPAWCSLAPLDRQQVDVSQLFKQAYGVIQTAAQYQGIELSTVKNFLSYAESGLRRIAIDRLKRNTATFRNIAFQRPSSPAVQTV